MAYLTNAAMLQRDSDIRAWILAHSKYFSQIKAAQQRVLIIKYGLGNTELGRAIMPEATRILSLQPFQAALGVPSKSRAQQLLKDAIQAFSWQLMRQLSINGHRVFPSAVGLQLGYGS